MSETDEPRPCSCYWKECPNYSKVIGDLAPSDHVWNTGKVRISLDPLSKRESWTIEKLAQHGALMHYAPLGENKKARQHNFRFAAHHFPIPLLTWRTKNGGKYFSDLLSSEEIDKMDFCHIGRQRMKEKSNSVRGLCSRRLAALPVEKAQGYKNKFVQTPMEDKKTVSSFVKELQNTKQGGRGRKWVSSPRKSDDDPVAPSQTQKDEGAPAHTPTAAIVSVQKDSTGFLRPVQPNERLLNSTPMMLSTNHQSDSPFADGLDINDDDVEEHPRVDIVTSDFVTPTCSISGHISSEGIPQYSPSHPRPVGLLARDGTPSTVDSKKGGPYKSRDLFDALDWMDRQLRILQAPAPSVVPSVSACRDGIVREYQKILYELDPSLLQGVLIPDEEYAPSSVEKKRLRSFLSYPKGSKGESPLFLAMRLSQEVRNLAKELIMQHSECDRFVLDRRGVWFFPCVGAMELPVKQVWEQCDLFSCRPYRWDKRSPVILCPSCASDSRTTLRKVWRVVQNSDRHRPWYSMSEEQKEETNRTRQKTEQKLRSKINRLELKLSQFKDTFVVTTDNKGVKEVLQKAASYVVGTNYQSSKKQILTELLRMELGGEGVNEQQAEECVSNILESIRNMALRLRGQDSQFRFSAHVVNTALTIFLKSKGAYDILRDSSIVTFPSPRRLSTMTSRLKATDGGDPRLYTILRREVSRRPPSELPLTGQLLVDEIKLRNGVAFNCQSNEITGVVIDDDPSHSLQNLYKDMFGSCEDDDSSTEKSKSAKQDKLNISANQWRFRSTRGVIHNGDFFFNSGSLTGNEMMRQYLQVVHSYELIGVRIAGIVCDGGGGNTGFMRLLRGGKKLQGPWPSEDCLRSKNPVDPSRHVGMILCATHGLKAARNNFFRSQDGKTRSFTKNGVGFGWKQVVECFERDEERRCQTKEGVDLPRTDLERHAVELDKYTTMNAKYAKQPFSEKTISEIMSFAASQLNVSVDAKETFTSQWHKFHHICGQLKAACDVNNPEVTDSIRGTVYALEYQVAVFGIYIERLLNRHWQLRLDNIDREEATMKKVVRYFTEWRNQRPYLQAKKGYAKKMDGDRHFLADVTYNNMILCVAGFFAYARAVLENAGGSYSDTLFIPALHCNQSSLESFFSRIRQLGRDRPDRYGGGVVQQNVVNDIGANDKRKKRRLMKCPKKGNTMYPEQDIGEEEGLCEDELILTARIDSVAKESDQFLSSLTQRLKSDRPTTTWLVGADFQCNNTTFGYMTTEVLQQLTLGGLSFQQFLIRDRRFRGFCALSHETENEKWFETILDPINEIATERICQDIISILFHLIEDCFVIRQGVTRELKHLNTNSSSTFECAVLALLQKMTPMPVLRWEQSLDMVYYSETQTVASRRVCYGILLDVLKDNLFRQWLPLCFRAVKAQSENMQQSTPNSLRTQEDPTSPNLATANANVNRLVGWAVFRVRKKYEKRCDMSTHDSDAENSDDENCEGRNGCGTESLKNTQADHDSSALILLEDLSVPEYDILGNREYNEKYYPMDDAIRNKGFLTLVSPAYIETFAELLLYILREVDQSKIEEDCKLRKSQMGIDLKQSVYAHMVLDGKAELIYDLVEISRKRVPDVNSSFDKEKRKAVFLEIVAKLLNMRIGSLIRRFRSDKVCRVNHVTFRDELAVLCSRHKKKPQSP